MKATLSVIFEEDFDVDINSHLSLRNQCETQMQKLLESGELRIKGDALVEITELKNDD